MNVPTAAWQLERAVIGSSVKVSPLSVPFAFLRLTSILGLNLLLSISW